MKIISAFLLVIAFFACFQSCKKSGSSSTYTTPGGKGTVVFWISDPAIAACGVTVHLSNGDQSAITSIYPATPTSCANVYGGYFYEDAGSYTYTVTNTGACTLAGGSVIFNSGGCGYVKVQ